MQCYAGDLRCKYSMPSSTDQVLELPRSRHEELDNPQHDGLSPYGGLQLLCPRIGSVPYPNAGLRMSRARSFSPREPNHSLADVFSPARTRRHSIHCVNCETLPAVSLPDPTGFLSMELAPPSTSAYGLGLELCPSGVQMYPSFAQQVEPVDDETRGNVLKNSITCVKHEPKYVFVSLERQSVLWVYLVESCRAFAHVL